jgi:hypothetical protein
MGLALTIPTILLISWFMGLTLNKGKPWAVQHFSGRCHGKCSIIFTAAILRLSSGRVQRNFCVRRFLPKSVPHSNQQEHADDVKKRDEAKPGRTEARRQF